MCRVASRNMCRVATTKMPAIASPTPCILSTHHMVCCVIEIRLNTVAQITRRTGKCTHKPLAHVLALPKTHAGPMTVPRNAITYLAVDQSLLNPFVLVARLQRHGVHAALATVVARAQPVLLDALQGRIAPREEVSGSTNTPRTSISHRPA